MACEMLKWFIKAMINKHTWLINQDGSGSVLS